MTPLIGQHLPFPWHPGLLGYVAGQYFITYRLAENLLEILSVTTLPPAEDVLSF